MNNNFYSIGRDIRVQKDCSSIGSHLIGEVALIYMLLQDERLLSKCKNLGITMDNYSHHVDDQLSVMHAIGRGWFFNKNIDRLVYAVN